MKTLKIFAVPLALAATALTFAGAAEAQPMRGHGAPMAWRLTPARAAQIRQDISQLNGQIDQAARRRTVSAREAGSLRSQARDVQRLYASYARRGLTRGEVQTLQNRVNKVRVALRMERRDWGRRPG
jgi:hypothetical protein